MSDLKAKPDVLIYTDGACKGNPGPGGYGVVLTYGKHRKELSGGYRLTTNNRMELTAAISALTALKRPCRVTLYSDSEYLVNAINQRWVYRWRSNGWKTKANKPAENRDLWESLLKLCSQHEVTFIWVRGHSGHPENERCDELAVQARSRDRLQKDPVYEEGLASSH